MFLKYVSIFFLCLISISVSLSQNTDKPIHEMERDFNKRFFDKNFADYRGDTNVNVTYYKLNLYITYSPNFLSGDVTINSTSRVNNLSNVFYDLSSNLTVDSILQNSELLPFDHSQNKIFITLNNSFNSGQNVAVKIFYHGVPVATGFGSFEFGSHNNNEPSIWTVSEPVGAIDWYPCKNSPSDKADSSDVWLRCSDQLTAVSNGSFEGMINNGDGTATYKWHNSYPIANYVISLAISNYAQYNFYYKYSPVDSMPVLNYIYPENLNNVKAELDKTNFMLDLFSDVYGPYPFLNEKYGHAEMGRIAGMENQTVSTMGVFNADIIAHELAHQWFGDKITCRNWENIWLNEGFATYGQAIYHEAVGGITAYNEFMRPTMATAKTAVGTIYVQDVNSIAQIFSPNRTYAKGCVVLHMLRGVLGDSAFFNTLRSFASDTALAYKTAVTEDFQNAAEQVSLQSLDYFFNQWIYGENYPKYNVSWTTEAAGNNLYKAIITIQQDINTFPHFFTMPVEIEIVTQAGDTVFNVFNNSQTQTFEFITNSKPLSFTIDPDNRILKDVRGDIVIPVNFSLNQNFPNPFNPKTNISYQLGKPSFVTITIYDILGNEMAVLVNGIQRDGSYNIEFNSGNLASGTYFYYFQAMDTEQINVLYENTGKMILIK
ncbi:MAG: T9SS type A sorting domain-containing protein [Ignavibacteria bacterium]|nr:T9SS type A sorting domain-containing protein [Ignavibacteria bacterium]